jgi:hypothetical protein
MELNKWRVYLDGVLLNNNPLGLNKLTKEFVRDNELFGIYSVSSFDLTFIGDGFCVLRDFQYNVDSCELVVRIQRYCNNSWVDVFDGIINVGSVEINESISQATCEIEDNSPLALISRNADVTIDLETTRDIFGGVVTPCTFSTFALGTPTNNSAYTADGVVWSDAVRLVLESITGVSVNVTSNFLSQAPLPTIYTLTYTGNLADITSSTIVYKNFQGETITVYANVNFGLPHLAEVGKRMLSSTQYIANTNANISKTLINNDDYRNFYFTSVDGSSKTITAYCNLPIEIISATADSIGAPITIAITKTQEFTDGGGDPILFNYRSIKNQASPYIFVTSFKDLMEQLNKEYNVMFVATYNVSGGIDFRIEDYQYFASGSINYTFDNVKDLVVKFDEEVASKDISVGDTSDTTLANKSYTFTANLCGIGQSFDAKSEYIIGSVQLWVDLASAYTDGLEDVIYMIDNSANMTLVQWTDEIYIVLSLYQGYVYNLYSTNWHKIYRHLNKFRTNIIGVAVYFYSDNNGYNINIENTSINRTFKSYEFNDTMTSQQFDALSDTIIDKAKFKRKDQTIYREGLIKSVSYNYESGKAEITILGK